MVEMAGVEPASRNTNQVGFTGLVCLKLQLNRLKQTKFYQHSPFKSWLKSGPEVVQWLV